MSRIRKAMMGRYIILMTILVISLTALLLALSNYTEIQDSKKSLETIIEKVHIAVQYDEGLE